MQQRQLRLGDILDDYCPRERRLTNHAVVAMIDGDVKQTRCTTCDAEHEYKHARVPRQRRKADTPPALFAQVAAGAPKRVPHDDPNGNTEFDESAIEPPIDEPEPPAQALDPVVEESVSAASLEDTSEEGPDDNTDEDEDVEREEGPVHRPLIRASLPRPDGQAPPARPAPDFTIRQPGGRPTRFRPRHPRAGQQFQGQGNRSNGNVGGAQRGRQPQKVVSPRGGRRNGPPQGRKRSK